MSEWNPWHGCRKLSPGCANCYVYRSDAKYGRDATHVAKTASFDAPLRKKRDGTYKLPTGETCWTCFTSDFLLAEADAWRPQAWEMMRQRPDVEFFFITKRIDRLEKCIPRDWGEGYENVTICCTAENQRMADYRLPIFRDAPIAHKLVICEPMLEPIDLSGILGSWADGGVVAGGESGEKARLFDYEWALALQRQCAAVGIPFWFKQTGALFRKDGRIYRIPRRLQHSQARKAGINIGKVRCRGRGGT